MDDLWNDIPCVADFDKDLMDDFGLDDLLGGLPDMAGFSTLVACDDNHDESINNNMALDLDGLDELPELRNMPMLSSEPIDSADKHASPAPSSNSQAKKIKVHWMPEVSANLTDA